MSENTMPAAEAVAVPDEQELASYELAFHVLPTVAEGEVTSVSDALKGHITKAGGDIFDEEAAKRFDLAYEIVKPLEGKNRSFKSAYFGWIRFHLDPAVIEKVTAEIEDEKSILRHLLIRLTKVEEENPFRFHEALETRTVEEVDIESDDSDDSDEADSKDADTDEGGAVDADTDGNVDEEELDEALKKEEA